MDSTLPGISCVERRTRSASPFRQASPAIQKTLARNRLVGLGSVPAQPMSPREGNWAESSASPMHSPLTASLRSWPKTSTPVTRVFRPEGRNRSSWPASKRPDSMRPTRSLRPFQA